MSNTSSVLLFQEVTNLFASKLKHIPESSLFGFSEDAKHFFGSNPRIGSFDLTIDRKAAYIVQVRAVVTPEPSSKRELNGLVNKLLEQLTYKHICHKHIMAASDAVVGLLLSVGASESYYVTAAVTCTSSDYAKAGADMEQASGGFFKPSEESAEDLLQLR